MRSAVHCTCQNLSCPIHPTKHDQGCTPCIAKNLKLGEIPNCFFNEVPGSEARTADHYEDFAEMVILSERGKRKPADRGK